MKKNIAHNSLGLLIIAFVVLLNASFKISDEGRNKAKFSQGETANKIAATEDLETIRKRIIDDLLEPAVQSDKIKRLINTIQQDGSWPGINYKDTSRTGFASEHRVANRK